MATCLIQWLQKLKVAEDPLAAARAQTIVGGRVSRSGTGSCDRSSRRTRSAGVLQEAATLVNLGVRSLALVGTCSADPMLMLRVRTRRVLQQTRVGDQLPVLAHLRIDLPGPPEPVEVVAAHGAANRPSPATCVTCPNGSLRRRSGSGGVCLSRRRHDAARSFLSPKRHITDEVGDDIGVRPGGPH